MTTTTDTFAVSQLPFTMSGVIDSIVAAIIMLVAAWLVNHPVARAFLKYNPFAARVITSIIVLAIFVVVSLFAQPTTAISVAIIAIIFLAAYNLYPLYRYHAIGVTDADVTVSSGIDYAASLKLCQNQFDFLGVGASKLTSQSEFVHLVRRCNRPARPIRLLLCDPADLIIEIGARRENVNFNQKRDEIQQSLKRIAELRNQGQNLQVRFYSAPDELSHPKFRLLFIDNRVCLVSYRVWGFGDGSALPQLQIAAHNGHPEERGFYYPFRDYFEALWQASQVNEWDFRKYL